MDLIPPSHHYSGFGNVHVPAAEGGVTPVGRPGSFRGEQVRALANPPSLSNYAEELAKAIHTRMERSDKNLGTRKLNAEPRNQRMSASEIASFLKASHIGDDVEKLQRTVAQLRLGRKPPKHIAREFSPDITQQYVVLEHALAQGTSDGAQSESLERIENALDELVSDHGPSIRAGLNTFEAAGESAKDLGEFTRFQGAYRDIVIGEASLAGALKIILSRLNSQSSAAFSRALRTLMKALGDDLAALRSSVEKSRLQALIADLDHLKVMTTVLEQCMQLCATLRSRHGAAAPERPA